VPWFLNPTVWLVCLGCLAGGYLKGCVDGGRGEKHANAAKVAQANIDSFKVAERRQRNVDEASELAAARARDDRARAVRADAVIDRLRGTLDATQSYAATSAQACARTVAAYRAVFGSCVAEYRGLGEEAAGHARDSLKLQQAWPR
jgi:hypothetical protein